MKTLDEQLLAASASGKTDEAKTLITQGARIDVRDSLGRTALHLAALHGEAGTVMSLIAAGSGVRLKDNAGFTPLHMGASRGHEAVCFALVNSGADINAIGNEGHTALHCAAEDGHTKTMLALIIAGAELEECNVDDLTPLDLASKNCRLNSALLLISFGCPRTPGREKYAFAPFSELTMLQAAVRGGFTDRLQVLLEKHPSHHPDDAPAALLKFAHYHIQRDAAAVIQAHMASKAIDQVLKTAPGMRVNANSQ